MLRRVQAKAPSGEMMVLHGGLGQPHDVLDVQHVVEHQLVGEMVMEQEYDHDHGREALNVQFHGQRCEGVATFQYDDLYAHHDA